MDDPQPPSAVFLDRDGTLITETGYLTDPEGWQFVPGAPAAVARLNRAGVPVALVTNQSAIARGMLDESGLAAIHGRISEGLAAEGAHLDEILYCPFHPDHEVERFGAFASWRKPLPGMLLEAARRFSVDVATAATIGDSDRDLRAGEACGARAILVRTGKGEAEQRLARARLQGEPTVVADLAAAVDLLLGPAT
ncbi:D-glycero-alpha-D-manno-heptose-1,7-bisphosphate 7-phosphatase [Engelhardtia mirabilis]|uniref:D-glycero-alpha-D-manno-heptose-1,7-bisphosphate 7-phosphatase n=1 Tax=Engelhardtia mirabilis TaxID=2528011 RepID=UPI003AF33E2C